MHIVMKVTKACNLRCSYCYVDQDSSEFMPVSLVETTIDKFGKHFKHLIFLWHGGEPLLAGLDFYRKAIEAQKRFTANHGVIFENQLQTNGTLLDDEWIRFLIANDFTFGISYDGPNESNGYRVDQNGNPNQLDYKSLFLKLKTEYRQTTGVLTVVNHYNITKPRELYSHYQELRIDTINFSPYLGGRSEVATLSPEEFFEFYKNIFDIWIRDQNPFIGISVINDIIHNLINLVCNQGCTWSGTCFRSNLSILPNGRIFPCLTLKDPNHCIGNILEGSVADILKNANYLQTYAAQRSVLQECIPCEYFDICKGGCRTAALRMTGSLGQKDPFCEGRKKLIRHIFLTLYSVLSDTPESSVNDLLNANDGFANLRNNLVASILRLDPNKIVSPALARIVRLYLDAASQTQQSVNI